MGADNVIVGLLGGLILGSVAAGLAAVAAYVVSLVAVEIRNMWRDER